MATFKFLFRFKSSGKILKNTKILIATNIVQLHLSTKLT